MSHKAVFLDRDGVLVEDVGPTASTKQLRLLPGVTDALRELSEAGFKLVVVTNQTVVARGIATLDDVEQAHGDLSRQLADLGCKVDGFYTCPHHPNATVTEFRLDCDCRKPKAGLLLRAADELDIDLSRSFMVGDRISDVLAGVNAGVRTVQVLTGRHADKPIESDSWPDRLPEPDFTCADLREASTIILDARMKALVLCAGYGTRLGTLTESTPKPMLPLAGKPLLAYTLEVLRENGFNDVAVNLHFKPEAIRDHFGDGSRYGVRLHYSLEPELLGTAGAVRSLRDFFEPDDNFLVIYGDILTDQNLAAVMDQHRARSAYATLVLHKRKASNSKVWMDDRGRITRFLERPEEGALADDKSWVNSGIQVLSREVFDDIPDGHSDLPRDVYVPHVTDRAIFGIPLTGFRCAIDSAERYELAGDAIAEGAFRAVPSPNADGSSRP